jgi:hypothetical protein
MKVHLLLLAQVFVWLALIQGTTWAQEKYTPSENEELFGTWTNEKMFPPQLVENPNGTFEEHFPIDNPKAFKGGTIEIVKKWTGSDGSIYYYSFDTTTFGADKGRKVKALWKISELGKVLEVVRRVTGWSEFDPKGMPTEIDPKDSFYQIFARSES